MARKDVFANLTSPANAQPERKAIAGYATRGATRSMINSLSELAEKAALADQAMTGEAVVDLDPALVDASFVTDRMDDDPEAFDALVEAIRERGQDTPVLVRPHPKIEGRYQIVFGHRRVRAARLLERPVRAVIKAVSDIDHVIAQGQENSARENLSFIERASFAQRLADLGHERRTIQQALTVDAPMLTRMLSVSGRIPASVTEAIGAAKGIGRDRWLDLAQRIEHPSARAVALAVIGEEDFSTLLSEARFERLLKAIKDAGKPARRAPAPGLWTAEDKAVAAEFKAAGKNYSIALKSKDAVKFGRFISANLERLYDEFKQTNQQGD
ncbi:plasmid partitioning protein RepB [Allorhizobium borbori]|uniref:ParB family chromosome partitioning protein n=1 Tax=Allorhizobium borbori TaxID=485907 RepID=A0A7W6K0Z4_9HYPH|nr:plasmid partitioning protein RepB [Allorhizobium borbori]MBB4103203.1 ParB family chromosome partitioning protein [Allorhizobium borbori]